MSTASSASSSQSSIHYCFIARDKDIVVFESILNKDLSAQTQAQRTAFKREVRDRLHDFERHSPEDPDESTNFALKALEGGTQQVATFPHFGRSFLPGDLKLSVLTDVVFIGCVTDSAAFSEDKATRFLQDLRNEFSKMYQGRLSLITKQTNLSANVYD